MAPLALIGGALGAAAPAALGATTALGGAAIGAGIGSMVGGLASKPKGIGTPQQRNYLGEMSGALGAQNQIMPQTLSLEEQYTPQWQALQKTSLMGQLGNLGSLYGNINDTSGSLTEKYAKTMAPAYGSIANTAMGAYNQMLGPTAAGVLATMNKTAAERLAAGGSLTAEEQLGASQAARAAMSARGLGMGNQGIAAEILGNYNLSNQRLLQNQAYANAVMGVNNATAGAAMNAYGTPLLGSVAGYNPSTMLATAGGMNQSLGPQLFNPESQYNAGVYGANQSNNTQVAIANQQAQAGWSSGLMSMGGSILGGYLGGKKV